MRREINLQMEIEEDSEHVHGSISNISPSAGQISRMDELQALVLVSSRLEKRARQITRGFSFLVSSIMHPLHIFLYHCHRLTLEKCPCSRNYNRYNPQAQTEISSKISSFPTKTIPFHRTHAHKGQSYPTQIEQRREQITLTLGGNRPDQKQQRTPRRSPRPPPKTPSFGRTPPSPHFYLPISGHADSESH